MSLRSRPRSLAARAGAGAACACAALALASCGKDPAPTGPLPVAPAPGPMVTLTGDPNVSVNVQGFVNRTAADDTLSGYYYVTLTDSSGRYAFTDSVTLNGVRLREETTGGGAPFRYALRPVDLGPAYRPSDALRFAVSGAPGLTDAFALALAPSTMDLAPDSTVLSQRKDYTVHWNGGPDLVSLTLTDGVGARVSARLQFVNETGLSQLLIRAQDLAVLTPGPLQAGSILSNSETFVASPHPRRITASLNVNDARAWRLAP